MAMCLAHVEECRWSTVCFWFCFRLLENNLVQELYLCLSTVLFITAGKSTTLSLNCACVASTVFRTVWSGGFLELHLRYLNSLLNPPDGRHLSLCVITEITFTALSMNWVCGIATVFCIACTAGTCLCYAAGVFNSVCCTTGVVTSLLMDGSWIWSISTVLCSTWTAGTCCCMLTVTPASLSVSRTCTICAVL